MNISRGFELAKKASQFSDYNKKNIHIGAVIMYKNKVISNGWNTNKTSPLQYTYNQYRELHCSNNREYSADSHLPCIHAEMKCLIDSKDIDINWSKASIFIYRENCGIIRMCRPCKSCQKALKDRGINKIYYTNENGEYIYEEI